MAYLPRQYKLRHYVPFTALLCYTLMIAGMSIWVHFTSVALNYVNQSMEIAGESVQCPTLSDVRELLAWLGLSRLTLLGAMTKISATVTALPIVYMVFGTAIFIMLTWRVWFEARADVTGQPHPLQRFYYFASIVLQLAWWIIMVVVVVDVMLDSSLASHIKIVSNTVSHTLDRILPKMGPAPPSAPGVCYLQCVDLSSYDFLDATNLADLCVCDPSTLTALERSLSSAREAARGTLVGIWLMFVAGGWLQMYVSFGFGRLVAQEDFEDRLEAVVLGGPNNQFARI